MNYSKSNIKTYQNQGKPFDRTIAYKEDELIATWLLFHNLDIKENEWQAKDDAAAMPMSGAGVGGGQGQGQDQGGLSN